ncbi:MAG: hypothetical protein AVDCRST_MAG76-1413, partial [uncultured Acidimicrobiales bacterium]
ELSGRHIPASALQWWLRQPPAKRPAGARRRCRVPAPVLERDRRLLHRLPVVRRPRRVPGLHGRAPSPAPPGRDLPRHRVR